MHWRVPETLVQSPATIQPSHAFEVELQRAAVALVHDMESQLHEGDAPLTSHAGCVAFVHASACPSRQVTQRFISVSHTGVDVPAHVLSAAVHRTHSCEAGSHTVPSGFPTQSVAVAHSPQTPAETQTGVAPEQAGLQSVASGGVNASAPLSGIEGSNASRPGASAFVSARGPASIADASGQIGLG